MKRRIIAIVLIVVGIAAAVFWEGWGREKILYDKVIVAGKDIQAGQTISSDVLTEKSVPRELLIDKAYTLDTAGEMIGKVASCYIPKNSQLNEEMVYIDDLYISKGQSIFYIPSNWIDSMSTSVRRGDTLEFWLEGATYKVGEYKVAFTKSEDETEVTNPSGSDKDLYAEGLNRTEGSGVATHIEIICTLNEYKNLYELATGVKYTTNDEETIKETIAVQKFLLIQKFV